ncbi:DUF1643 domain-containing protein [Escherichia coli]|nr:DUF1643 domain-containing protein [Escherichia coli]
MPAFEWVHVQLHQQKGMISLSPPTICNSALIRLVSGAGLVVAAWGNEGRHLKRSTTVRQLLPESTMCFVLNATGEPKHPLYMKNDSVLIPLG